MVQFEKVYLDNGLCVLLHNDSLSSQVAVNILYKVGARNENPQKTGFAHLFEHLMFEGSVNIPYYDRELQKVGGDNNAFTNNDITNYYLTLPSHNIETGLWLESDRMLGLSFSEEKLETQKNVVIEEFKQRYLNQPYGDVWLLLRPLAYKVHPYHWPTIGKEISHIQKATLDDVKDFFYSHYAPNNAILSIAGNINIDQTIKLTNKWFGDISKRTLTHQKLPKEPEQKSPRHQTVKRDVPASSIYKCWHICNRNDKRYYSIDLLSDVLSRGASSRLHQNLVKEQKIFSEISAYVTGDIDEGLFIIGGKMADHISVDEAETKLAEELEKLKNEKIKEQELVKVVNKIESAFEFSLTSVFNKAMNLAIYEGIGDAKLINEEINRYKEVTPEQIQDEAIKILNENNCSTLHYLKN